ncbi:DUF2637 domain-containing protein [Dactylosporangium aurantiacum]|uniref:DUF2637 domain-containing protein n=1 Tax=Dactylosporangium aurantiacum TaxID=35754 RepID=A0A9Q9INH3_9ACTN|nr:DUF2637 domain-containing protein [Dactylosporangium aurantiacum]MDG6107665.1 DUF2637 domain-containing protein [Dactylosporangium aurantiacum]UWZ58741.1 DUF2637 domain-containing protein [Dactylosporangium aurantiacum]
MNATHDTRHITAGPATVAGQHDDELRRLRLIQWTLRGALALALVVSMAANILAAAPDPVARSIAAWSPLALYTAIEVMTRVPVRNRLLGAIRIVATVAIAVIAGVTSYLHMVGVGQRYGESWQVVYLLPISVDGLVTVLTLSLLDIASQVRSAIVRAAAVQKHQSIIPVVSDSTSIGGSATQAQRNIDADEGGDVATSMSGSTGQDAEASRRPLGTRRPTGRARAQRATPPVRVSETVALPPELEPLLQPATQVLQELQAAGRPITRDCFAAALRDAGQPLRSAKVTLLLAAVRNQHAQQNGS